VAVAACQAAPEASPGASDRGDGAGAPFDLTVEDIVIVGMDNAGILGVAGTPPSDAAAAAAVSAARDALGAFLNAQLVDEATRFSAAPVDQLLSARARATASENDRAGLGQVDLPVARTITGPASAVAEVLLHGEEVHAVTLSFNALLTVELAGGTASAAKQSGAMTFLPTEEGWRADAVEVTIELPEGAP